jgi:hypothetical protein
LRGVARLLLPLLLAVAACRRDARTPLTLYSPHGRDLLALVEKTYEASHPEVDVRWLDMGSQEVYDRIRSEKANPQADVWFGGPDTIFSRGARDGLLAPNRPSWAGAVPEESRARGDLFFGLYRRPRSSSARQPRRAMRRATGRTSRTPIHRTDPDPRSARLRHHAWAIFGMVIERSTPRPRASPG